MNVITAGGGGPAPPTGSGWATLSAAADYSTSSATAVEIDSSLRVTVVVSATGKVRIRHSLCANTATDNQDTITAVQVDGAGAWTDVAGSNLSHHDDFGADYLTFQGEVELTGISAGSHTFYMGWRTSGGHVMSCKPSSINAGMGLATWQAVVTLP